MSDDKLKKILAEKKPEFFDANLIRPEKEKKTLGRPKKIEGETIRTTIVLTEKIIDEIQPKIKTYGSISEYVRFLIEKDLK